MGRIPPPLVADEGGRRPNEQRLPASASEAESLLRIERGAEAPAVRDEAKRKRGELRSEAAAPRRNHDYSEPDRTSEAK